MVWCGDSTDSLFSAHAEVIPLGLDSEVVESTLLRACGGNSRRSR